MVSNMWYWLSILGFTLLIGGVNAFFYAPIWHVFVGAFGATVAVIAIDGLLAFVIRWLLPAKWFSHDKKFFAGRKAECRFYEKIGIKKWKDKVPELGDLTGFRKNKISDPTNNEFIARYILEANYGLTLHFLGMIFGFLIMLIYPQFALNIAFPVAVVNFGFNFLSFAILRYNLPKLHTLYKFNLRRAKNAEKTVEQEKIA